MKDCTLAKGMIAAPYPKLKQLRVLTSTITAYCKLKARLHNSMSLDADPMLD